MTVKEYLEENDFEEYDVVIHEGKSVIFMDDLAEEDRNAILLSDIKKYDKKELECYNGWTKGTLNIYTNCLHKIL